MDGRPLTDLELALVLLIEGDVWAAKGVNGPEIVFKVVCDFVWAPLHIVSTPVVTDSCSMQISGNWKSDGVDERVLN